MSNVVNKNQHLTKEQKDILINFVQEHEDIQCGKFTATFTHKKMQVLWEQVTATLNSVPQGAIKDWRQWRKTWQDMKKKVKLKASMNRAAFQTGGGPPPSPPPPFDTQEAEILNMIPSVVTAGLDVAETPANFNFDIQSEVIIDDDHTYSMEESSTAVNKNSASKLSKTRRLDKSLKITNDFVKGMDQRTALTEKYYMSKIDYYTHRKSYEQEKLLVHKKTNELLQTALQELKEMKDLIKMYIKK